MIDSAIQPKINQEVSLETQSGIENSKRRALFIPAPVRSHIVPTLHIAELLSREYQIFYAVTGPVLAAIVIENGFTPIENSMLRVATGMEPNYLSEQGRRTGFWPNIRSMLTNEVYWQRRSELEDILARIKPDVIFMDIFDSSDFLVLYPHRATVRLLFYNPMLSTYQIDGLPMVSDAIWPASAVTTPSAKLSLRDILHHPVKLLSQAAVRYQLAQIVKLAGMSDDCHIVDTHLARLFTNVPELVLAPLEFEFSPRVRQPQQYYLGLCIPETRTDTELDPEFAEQWPILLSQQQAGQRLIYCSFGTYYTGSDKALLHFVTNLLTAIQTVANVQLVCSVNSLVVQTLQATYAPLPNVHFFRRVPQLVVLQHAAVHITHGGLGSVKESIYHGVPMLVCPLNTYNDQPGNGLKIEYHGIGLRGNFRWESTFALQEKIIRLLDDTTFRTNLTRFKQDCATNYTDERVTNILIKLLSDATL